MILVDSSVWIDFFRDGRSAQSQTLARCLGDSSVEVGMADLVLFEVMRGFREGVLLRDAQTLMSALPQVEIGGTAPVLKIFSVLPKNEIEESPADYPAPQEMKPRILLLLVGQWRDSEWY